MYKVFKLDNGAVQCHLIYDKKEEILNIPEVLEYFQDDFENDTINEIEIIEIPENQLVDVDFEGINIELPAKQWALIYGGIVKMLSQSEY